MPMRLLVLSHPCVTPINQQFFAAVEAHTGWEVSLIVPAAWRNEYAAVLRPGRWESFRGQVIALPVWKSGSVPLHAYRTAFVPLLRRLQPDIIYAHHEPYAVATAQLYLANRLTLRRPIGFYSAQNILKRYPPPFSWAERMVFAQSAYAFPVSGSVATVLAQKGYAGTATVLPLGIDPTVYLPDAGSSALGASLRTRPDELLIGYLGRLVEEKGLRTLLLALQQIRELPWRLVVVGAGNYEGEFDRLAASLGLADRIRRVGFVPHTEAPRYLAAIDLLVLPSETRPNWKEQFGRVLVEALACGTPVVGSDSGEIPFVVRATGGGTVFREGDPADFARALRRMITDSEARDRYRVKGQAHVLEHLSNAQVVRQFVGTLTAAHHAHPRTRARSPA